MKTIYIDSEFKCHVTSGEGLTPIETDAFDGECDTYIEGYRFIPAGQTWTRADGMVFTGEMISPGSRGRSWTLHSGSMSGNSIRRL